MKHFIAAALLAVAFLGAQQAAVLHWLSHSIDAAQAKGKAGAGNLAEHCDACLAFSGLGTGAAAAEVAAALPSAVAPLACAADAEAGPTAFRAVFRSRAPPIRS